MQPGAAIIRAALKSTIWAAACAFAWPGRMAQAATDVEPVAIEEVVPTERGHASLKLNVEAIHGAAQEEGAERPRLYALPQARLFFGISERLGGEVQFPFVLRRDKIAGESADGEPLDRHWSRSGIGDVALGLKALLREEDGAWPALAAGFELGLPTASRDKELGVGKTGYAWRIGAQQGWGRISALTSAGFQITNQASERAIPCEAALAYSIGRWSLHAEISGAFDLNDRHDRLALGPALGVHVSESIRVASSVLAGLTRHTPATAGLLQVQLGWGKEGAR